VWLSRTAVVVVGRGVEFLRSTTTSSQTFDFALFFLLPARGLPRGGGGLQKQRLTVRFHALNQQQPSGKRKRVLARSDGALRNVLRKRERRAQ
jgi:hypothetical protein